MANLVQDRQFPRGQPDNTGVLWADVQAFAATAAQFAAVSDWAQNDGRRRSRLVRFRARGPGVSGGAGEVITGLDPATFVAVADWAQNTGRRRSSQLRFRSRGPGVSGGAGIPYDPAIFSAIESWRAARTYERVRQRDPRYGRPPDPGRSGLTFTVTRALTAIGVVTARRQTQHLGALVATGVVAALRTVVPGLATLWPGIAAWGAAVRTPDRTARRPDPGDAWSFGAGTPGPSFTPAQYAAIDAWTRTGRLATRVTFRSRGPGVSGGAGSALPPFAGIAPWPSTRPALRGRWPDAGDYAWSFGVSESDLIAQRWPAIEWGIRAQRTRARRPLDVRYLRPLDAGRGVGALVTLTRALVAIGVPHRVLQTQLTRARAATGVVARVLQTRLARSRVAVGVVGHATQVVRLITRAFVAIGVVGASRVFLPAAFIAAYWPAIEAWSRAGRTAARVLRPRLGDVPWLAKPVFQFLVTRPLTATGVVVRVLQTRLTRTRVAVGVVTHATQFVRLVTRALVAVGVPHRILQTQLVPRALVAHGVAAARRQTQMLRALLEFAAVASIRQTRKTRAAVAIGLAHLATTRFTMVTRALIAHGIAGFQAVYLPFTAGLGSIYVNILRRRRRKRDG